MLVHMSNTFHHQGEPMMGMRRAMTSSLRHRLPITDTLAFTSVFFCAPQVVEPGLTFIENDARHVAISLCMGGNWKRSTAQCREVPLATKARPSLVKRSLHGRSAGGNLTHSPVCEWTRQNPPRPRSILTTPSMRASTNGTSPVSMVREKIADNEMKRTLVEGLRASWRRAHLS